MAQPQPSPRECDVHSCVLLADDHACLTNRSCELPFGHPGPHSQPGGVGKRERKKRVKEDLTG